MSRKSGNRFSEKDMRQQRDLEHSRFHLIGKCSRSASACSVRTQKKTPAEPGVRREATIVLIGLAADQISNRNNSGPSAATRRRSGSGNNKRRATNNIRRAEPALPRQRRRRS